MRASTGAGGFVENARSPTAGASGGAGRVGCRQWRARAVDAYLPHPNPKARTPLGGRPTRRRFWLSHVPDERFEGFWAKVAACLNADGRVVFVDDAYRSPDELIYGADSSVIQRRLEDGSTHRIVKMAHRPAALQQQLSQLGWQFEMTDAPPFFWGVGRRARP